jgi:hypothetical protein
MIERATRTSANTHYFFIDKTWPFPFLLIISIILGLSLFLYREMRRPPLQMEWGRTPIWPKRIKVVLISLPLVAVLLLFWAIFIEPGRLVVRHETIQIANWPTQLSGLKIAVLSDIHAGGWAIDEQKLKLIVQRTNELQPDLILIAGDYMSV